MEAFIVRPFGKKSGVDFDEVEEKLILPSLQKAGIKGYTTGVILEAGNIRQDMFQLLLTSDLVIADISIHNANVFYELGIRHALRAKKTILIRCQKDAVPFDLKTDRYIAYDQSDLENSVHLLYESVRQTLNSDGTDSPVFKMLPQLKPQNPEYFLAVPSDFADEVYLAKATDQQGRLALLAKEAAFFSWELPALRMIGESPYRSKHYENAREIWERVKRKKPSDIEANTFLATIYQRLAEKGAKQKPNLEKRLFAKSDQAIDCLFRQFENLNRNKRAETFALKARNYKAQWVSRWIDLKPKKAVKEAIRSVTLLKAYENYVSGFFEDLNHFYSGVNALGLLKIVIDLAEREKTVWQAKFDTSGEAKTALKIYKEDFVNLAVVVKKAVESEIKVLERAKKTDPWVEMTLADVALLTGGNPNRVANRYHAAIHSGMGLNLEAPLRQLRIYERLEIVPDNVQAALYEFKDYKAGSEDKNEKVLLFTGHMIDADNRKEPRFPKEREDEIRKKIKKKVEKIIETTSSAANCVGIAGGACGGDLLFLEVCKELGMRTKMYLALPPEKYIVESVQFAGNSWVERFYNIFEDENTETDILADSKTLPRWLQGKEGYSFWERNNMWLLYTALSLGSRNLTLIAVWDGKGEDGPGGTRHMIQEIKARGAESKVISI